MAEILGGYQCPKCGTREFSTLGLYSQENWRYLECGVCLFEVSLSGNGFVLGKLLRRGDK